jgi:N,N'-diacetyllegionaminate synthase
MKTYVIAEIGINHNGSIENCFKMIDAAVDAGCGAAKFQFFSAASLYPKSAGKLDWKDGKKKYSYDIYKAVERFELSRDWLDRLIAYCKNRRIDFLSSVFDAAGADLLIKKGMKKIKLSSYSVTNIPLIEHCAKAHVPIILSTGGALLGEIEEAVLTVLKYHNELSLLHCNISYPVKLKDCNLGVIRTLKTAFPGLKAGFSDHTIEVSDAAVQSVYLGAEIIEKHITLDKKMAGPDHFFALEPYELAEMVLDIKKAEKDTARGCFKIDWCLYGSSKKTVYPHERYMRDFCFSTIFTKRPIKRGQQIRRKDLAILRAGKKGHGLAPKHIKLFDRYQILAVQDMGSEEPVSWGMIFNAKDTIQG